MTGIETTLAPLWPYIVLIIVGFLPSEIWRMLGVILARGLDDRSQIIVWVRAVATTAARCRRDEIADDADRSPCCGAVLHSVCRSRHRCWGILPVSAFRHCRCADR